MLVEGLPRVVANPDDVDTHGNNLIGACLAGVAMAQAGIGIHHRTAHVLGGGWKTPHGETHAVLLPQTTAMVGPHASDAMAHASRMLGSEDPADALFALLQRLMLPVALSELGMPEDGLDEAAHRVWEATHDDPLVPDEATVRSDAGQRVRRPQTTGESAAPTRCRPRCRLTSAAEHRALRHITRSRVSDRLVLCESLNASAQRQRDPAFPERVVRFRVVTFLAQSARFRTGNE